MKLSNICELIEGLGDNITCLITSKEIGEGNLIASNTTIGGRTIVGADCWIRLGAIISNGLTIGEKCSISLGSVVTRSLENKDRV